MSSAPSKASEVRGSQHQKASLSAAIREQQRRLMEALRIYEPLPFQERLHACRAREAVVLKGNQVGGSLCGFVEVARAATGQDPHNKYPKENGLAVCIGYGEKHIGRVIHKYLFRPGAFNMIKDLETDLWRVYRPWSRDEIVNGKPGDKERKAECRPSLPLIPPRMIKNFAWEKRADFIFSRVELTNGWSIVAYNSAGDPKQAQGFQAHLILIDEDTVMPGWHNEMLQRTVHVDGLLRWTALPHMKNEEMMDLIRRAEDDESNPNPTSVMIRATAYDNIYYPKEALKDNEKILKQQGMDVWRRRMMGEIVIDSVLMYPTFHKEIHSAIKFSEPRNEVQRILTESNGIPPRDWCRYLIIDPGHTVCNVSFFAVPPPQKFGDFKIQYDELYLRNCDVHILVKNVKPKVEGYIFEEFLIDMHGASLREIGSGELPLHVYERAFEEHGIKSEKTGHGFRPGCDIIETRVMILRQWLSIREDGTTKFMFVPAYCPNLANEFPKFRKKSANVLGSVVYLDEGDRRNTHAIECAEYAAAHGLPYVDPASHKKIVRRTDLIYDRIQKARARLSGGGKGFVNLGS